MTRFLDRRKAFELRKQGKSYSQIKKELGMSKSTLSQWLRKYPLTKEQIDSLRGKSEVRIEKYRETMRRKREERFDKYYNEEKALWLPLSKRELFIAGLFLYWGEGNKSQRNMLSINNTDPAVIQFALFWVIKSLNVQKSDVRLQLHLYSDMDIDKELVYWCNVLKVKKHQFNKPYIKQSKRADIDQKGFGHGTCGIQIGNTVLKERILALIQAMGDYVRNKF